MTFAAQAYANLIGTLTPMQLAFTLATIAILSAIIFTQLTIKGRQ